MLRVQNVLLTSFGATADSVLMLAGGAMGVATAAMRRTKTTAVSFRFHSFHFYNDTL